jgi:hypothetical protein
MRHAYTLLVVGLWLAAPAPLMAQTETRAAVAEGLYRQARDLMAAGNYAEACPKFAESQRLDPATGTLLNLAACHEKQGKLATAWLEYSDALVAARRDAREDRVAYARDHVQELEPKLSRLTLSLAAGADDPTLEIELDGANVGRGAIGAPTPVDPGPHTVRVSAAGKKPWTAKVELGNAADQKSLLIPQLEAAAPLASQPASTDVSSHQPVSAPTQPARDELTPGPIPRSAYVAGGITLAFVVGAGASGIAYLQKRSDYNERKHAPDAQDRRDSAKAYGYLNAGMWAATAVGAGVTTFLYVTRPTRAAQATARITPWAAPQSAGLSVTGGF